MLSRIHEEIKKNKEKSPPCFDHASFDGAFFIKYDQRIIYSYEETVPVFSAKPPERLYRGHHIPQEEGDLLLPHPTPTCEGKDVGKAVYASSNLWHAAAYGLKFRPSSIGLRTINGTRFPFVFLGFPNQGFASFDEMQKGYTCLQLVSPANFKWGVFDNKPHEGETAKEWFSLEPVKVEKVWMIPNSKLLRNGIQVFSTTWKVLDKYWKCSDDWHLGELLRAKLITWENLHPAYNNLPLARPSCLLERLGFEEYKCTPRSGRRTAPPTPRLFPSATP